MEIDKIITNIDAEIATRNSENIGIKVGDTLFDELIKAGKVKKTKFGILGTDLAAHQADAYDGKYPVTRDSELDDEAFSVGMPRK